MTTAPNGEFRPRCRTGAQRVSGVIEAARAGIGACSLTEIARALAARPELWSRHVEQGRTQRSYVQLYDGVDIEVWILTWPAGTSTSLHDHGGSAGAFTVTSGCLAETRSIGKSLERDLVPAGKTRRFDSGHIHDVGNPFGSPAVSVHVYSPPLTSQRYYEHADGQLVEVDAPADERSAPIEVAA